MGNENQIILLDLGGVLADLGSPTARMDLPMSAERFWQFWIKSDLVREFETGALSTQEFCDELATELKSRNRENFQKVFRRWRLELYSGTKVLLHELSRSTTLALLSNTNEVHWEQIREQMDVNESFDKLFLSYETGFYKPNEAAYLQVLNHYECKPDQVLFFDDSSANVEAALRLGFDAHRVSGVVQLAQTLDEQLDGHSFSGQSRAT